jgi:hypothetical protein
MNSGNACQEPNVLWACRNEHDFEQFQGICDALPTGNVRYCCPSTFAPTCGAGSCSPYPAADEALCGGMYPPHAYRCIFPYTAAPAGCMLRLVGDVTDMYCCP